MIYLSKDLAGITIRAVLFAALLAVYMGVEAVVAVTDYQKRRATR